MPDPQWTRVYETPAEGIVGLASQLFTILALSACLLHFIGNVVMPNRKRLQKFQNIDILFILCFVCAILYCASNLLFHCFIVFVRNVNCRFRTWTVILFLLHRVMLYWFYIERVHITFQESVLSVERSYLTVLRVLSSLSISIAAAFLYYAQRSSCEDEVQSLAVIPCLMIDIFWCFFLSMLFVAKLKQTLVQFRNDEQEVNHRLVMLMFKLTNLIVWSSFIMPVSFWIFSYMTGWIITAVSANVFIVCAALLMTFNTYARIYRHRVCCLCHACLSKCCRVRVVQHIQRRTEQLDLTQSARYYSGDRHKPSTSTEETQQSDDEDSKADERSLVAKIDHNVRKLHERDVDDASDAMYYE